jgi:hypothetical protein
MNKYRSHVYVIPEDDRNRQIADGFVLHDQVNGARIKVVPPAGGWLRVLEMFREEYVSLLRDYKEAHVVMLIDFDGQVKQRNTKFQQEIPEEYKRRVFVVGSRQDPEGLNRALNGIGFEKIGESLAAECGANSAVHWNHEQLHHNHTERERLIQTVRPFLF